MSEFETTSNVPSSKYEAAPESYSASSEKQPPRFEVAGEAHHDTDSKDQRSLSNRLAAAQEHEKQEETAEKQATITDPLAPAKLHGNEPSRGAKIDAQIQREEEQILKKKQD
ncbi:hypothetical protein CPB83DRAFT_830594 [Crepidotus variabilis]|uniref:Uncharacterized protein n=1 Tax=Crepidotus variabilis TaxID=179855 RepID=A0A9P6EV75_9AGAR|nr:hypothetical protein CPB83DRAFT_830594 [Crepidotus variabilis]